MIAAPPIDAAIEMDRIVADEKLPGELWRGVDEDTGLPCAVVRDQEDDSLEPMLCFGHEWRMARGPSWNRVIVAWAFAERRRAEMAESAVSAAADALRVSESFIVSVREKAEDAKLYDHRGRRNEEAASLGVEILTLLRVCDIARAALSRADKAAPDSHVEVTQHAYECAKTLDATHFCTCKKASQERPPGT